VPEIARLRSISALYAIEEAIRGKPPQQWLRVRQEQARPLLLAMEGWLRETVTTMSRKSDTTAAILYALNRWQALTRYCDDGVEINNSAADPALREVALRGKNSLFAGADSGGERAAGIYVLIGTAKLNGLDPERHTPVIGTTQLAILLHACHGPFSAPATYAVCSSLIHTNK